MTNRRDSRAIHIPGPIAVPNLPGRAIRRQSVRFDGRPGDMAGLQGALCRVRTGGCCGRGVGGAERRARCGVPGVAPETLRDVLPAGVAEETLAGGGGAGLARRARAVGAGGVHVAVAEARWGGGLERRSKRTSLLGF